MWLIKLTMVSSHFFMVIIMPRDRSHLCMFAQHCELSILSVCRFVCCAQTVKQIELVLLRTDPSAYL